MKRSNQGPGDDEPDIFEGQLNDLAPVLKREVLMARLSQSVLTRLDLIIDGLRREGHVLSESSTKSADRLAFGERDSSDRFRRLELVVEIQAIVANVREDGGDDE